MAMIYKNNCRCMQSSTGISCVRRVRRDNEGVKVSAGLLLGWLLWLSGIRMVILSSEVRCFSMASTGWSCLLWRVDISR